MVILRRDYYLLFLLCHWNLHRGLPFVSDAQFMKSVVTGDSFSLPVSLIGNFVH